MHNKRTAGIIIAAGYDRNGEKLDPLMELGSTTLVKRIVLTYQLAGISPILIITGLDGLSVERHIADYGVIFFRTEDMFQFHFETDVIPVLKYAAEKSEQIVITPVEYPLFGHSTIKELMECDGEAVAPVVNGDVGSPLVLSVDAISKIESVKKATISNWKKFAEDCSLKLTTLEVEDKGCVSDIRDLETCKRILEKHDKQMLHPYVRLDIDCPTRIFGPRLKMLLLLIRDTQSVKNACQRISLSIGKAWEIINDLEGVLGYQVVKRRQGGSRGGRTELTPEGEAYLEKYMQLEKRVQDFANEEFGRIFLDE